MSDAERVAMAISKSFFEAETDSSRVQTTSTREMGDHGVRSRVLADPWWTPDLM